MTEREIRGPKVSSCDSISGENAAAFGNPGQQQEVQLLIHPVLKFKKK